MVTPFYSNDLVQIIVAINLVKAPGLEHCDDREVLP